MCESIQPSLENGKQNTLEEDRFFFPSIYQLLVAPQQGVRPAMLSSVMLP